MDPIDFVAQAETDLLSMAKRSSKEYLHAILADGFIEIGQSGQYYDKASIIAALLAAPQTQASLNDLEIRRLSHDYILASYKTLNKTRTAQPICRHSLWQKLDKKWQLLYHEAEIHMEIQKENHNG